MAVAAVGLLAVAASCGESDTTSTTSESDSNTAPFHAVPDDAQVVWGTVQCRPLPRAELTLECELDMSDPRVSGAETIEEFQIVAPGSVGRVWIFESDVITNAEGTWRGNSQGADDPPGNPIGESHLVGEGAYEGLEFHYYFTEPVLLEGGFLRGWISESTPADPASSSAPVTPFHPVPEGTVAVSGTAACDSTGSGAVNAEGELDVLVTCQLDLSDPRVSGTETQDRVRILAGSIGAGDVRVADGARITAPEGTWRGMIQAATDDGSVPTSVGEARYIGEGAYEGLEFHYYFADLFSAEGGEVRVHGWISPAT
jgi:hypothetical protein